jgi:hypothetical protein
MTPIRKAALMAAQMYLSEKKARTLKECIAASASKYEVGWVPVANYLSGVGARALLTEEQICALQITYEALIMIRSADIDWGGLVFADCPVPQGSVTHQMLWACDDAFTVLENTGFFEEAQL